MFVVVASRHDPQAAALVARWAERSAVEVALLTPAALSQPGWRFQPSAPRRTTVPLNGRSVPVGKVEGVVTRLSRVLSQDLPHIASADRSYVAQEMTAFLLAWLASLDCPVLNRPSLTCLAGPGWRQEHWLALAARLGIPVKRLERSAVWPVAPGSPAEAEPPRAAISTVMVAGGEAFGQADPSLLDQARRLAAAAVCDLLSVHFDSPEADGILVGVDLWPDLSMPAIADATLACLERGKPC